jgi:hypothetical protein
MIAGAIAGAALTLIPRAAEAMANRLPPPPAGGQGDALTDIEPNPRGITRAEVEAAIADWCTSHADAALCVKLAR